MGPRDNENNLALANKSSLVISSLKSATKPSESYDEWHNRKKNFASGIQVLTDMPEFDWLQPFKKRPIICKTDIMLKEFGSGTGTKAMSAGMLPEAVVRSTSATLVEGVSQVQEVEHTRTNFPETWLWIKTTSNGQGQAKISVMVPDTITSWIASAFSVNKITGLGVTSAPAKFHTFRPFFVNLNLPYSVVSGEELVLQANVFNYLTQDMDVVVTLEKSNNFKVILSLDASGEIQYVSEIVTKNVKPEGTHRENNYPFIFAAGSYVKVLVILPRNVVADSLKVRVTAVGDIMGPTLKNLDSLLQLPTGCGEQTMASFAPNIFVTNYLNATGQLTNDIRERALTYIQRGDKI
ncbi:hypothetical protein CHS0354_032637 [Potamilus streckersoni]|uniref:Alpha-2-macroglobulin domain-containing protein n=1 Tax=Potamilus streckersoni TaxID=2493646 RepID=A0AAE0SG91_9BIVA|nr:hypothetical protein CHS0354_032637 [Potamilus streckersoni]